MTPLLLALALTNTASAGGMAPPMWGVGPTLSTVLLPGYHPVSMPRVGSDSSIPKAYYNDNRYLSDDYFKDVRGDAALGARAVVYADNTLRFAVRGNFGFGKNYSSNQFGLEVDKTLAGEGRISAFGGAGIGVGSMKFKADGDPAEGAQFSDAYFRASQYPIRGHLGATYRLNKQAFELSIFAQAPLPGRQMFYWDENGTQQEEQIRAGFNPLQYFNAGIELAAYFGDFKLREGGKKGKKGKKGRR